MTNEDVLALVVGACSTTAGQLTDDEHTLMTPVHHVFAARLDYSRLCCPLAARD